MFKESHTSTEVVEIVNVLNAVPVTKAILAGDVDVVKMFPQDPAWETALHLGYRRQKVFS